MIRPSRDVVTKPWNYCITNGAVSITGVKRGPSELDHFCLIPLFSSSFISSCQKYFLYNPALPASRGVCNNIPCLTIGETRPIREHAICVHDQAPREGCSAQPQPREIEFVVNVLLPSHLFYFLSILLPLFFLHWYHCISCRVARLLC
jgi:hypothetical protein